MRAIPEEFFSLWTEEEKVWVARWFDDPVFVDARDQFEAINKALGKETDRIERGRMIQRRAKLAEFEDIE